MHHLLGTNVVTTFRCASELDLSGPLGRREAQGCSCAPAGQGSHRAEPQAERDGGPGRNGLGLSSAWRRGASEAEGEASVAGRGRPVSGALAHCLMVQEEVEESYERVWDPPCRRCGMPRGPLLTETEKTAI